MLKRINDDNNPCDNPLPIGIFLVLCLIDAKIERKRTDTVSPGVSPATSDMPRRENIIIRYLHLALILLTYLSGPLSCALLKTVLSETVRGEGAGLGQTAFMEDTPWNEDFNLSYLVILWCRVST